MQLLDAINLIMPKLGERPVTSLEVKHPTLAVLLPIVEQTRITTLQSGWWFNEYDSTLYPDVAGEIAVGTDIITFVPQCDGEAIVRGNRLYNPKTLTFVFTQAVKGRLVQDVEFDLLPESVANYIMYSALIEAYSTDVGVTQELQVWQTLAARAFSSMTAEHLRQRKHTTRKTRRWRTLIRALQG
ncbi:MAG TPA: hypothetical protein VM783_17860 [Candidatus Acidoferrum sp.]|nr:hypothetical protein [Candidatus Acidoferrum sp.]